MLLLLPQRATDGVSAALMAPHVPPRRHPCMFCTAELYRLDAIDYGRRMATEKELAADTGGQAGRHACGLGGACVLPL